MRPRIKSHKLTPAEVDRQRDGAEILGPGIWVDRDGEGHISVPEVLAEIGLPYTEENLQIALNAVREVFEREHPRCEVIVQEEAVAPPRPSHWPEMVERARLDVRAGATHDCGEWRGDSVGVEPADCCALCGTRLVRDGA